MLPAPAASMRDTHSGALPEVAMVLGAGHGTRLGPLTDELPKPLVPLGDRSVLGHVAARLAAAGVSRLVINSHHLAERYDEATLRSLGIAAELVYEKELLGTAGGVAGSAEALGGGDALVVNGDIVADIDLPALAKAHERFGAMATLAVVGGLGPSSGTVGLDEAGRVVRLRDRSFGTEVEGAEFVGAQLIAVALRERLPRRGCLVGDVYLRALEDGLELRAAAVATAFTDIGTPRAYLDANLAWLEARAATSFVASGAVVAPGIRLAHTVVGAGAEVVGHGSLVASIVWPGARARAPASDVIVTTAGRVVSVAH